MGGETLCPNCKQAIRPTLFQYLPPRYSRKQYKCPHCGFWLTIDGRSRFVMFVVGFGVFMSLTIPMLLSMEAIHRMIPLERHLFAVLLAGLPMVASVIAAALAVRHVAGWEVAPESAWDLPDWVHRDK